MIDIITNKWYYIIFQSNGVNMKNAIAAIEQERMIMGLEKFKAEFSISRAIYWNAKSGRFNPRAFSATIIAQKTNAAYMAFLTNHKKSIESWKTTEAQEFLQQMIGAQLILTER